MSCIGVRLDLTPDLLAQPARLVAPLPDDVAALGCGVPGLQVGLRVGVRLPSTLYAAETRLKASSEPPGLSGCEASETLR